MDRDPRRGPQRRARRRSASAAGCRGGPGHAVIIGLRRLAWLAASLLVAAGFVRLWQAAADHRLVSPVFLPGPDRGWAALLRGFARGTLTANLAGTVERMMFGWLIASPVGVTLGAAIGTSPRLKTYLQPLLEFLPPARLGVHPRRHRRPWPLGRHGTRHRGPRLVVAVLLATIHGFASVEPRFYEVARALQTSRLATIRRIALPSAAPDVLAGMRLGLTVALILAVVCEMLAAREGLGNWILLAARSFRAPDLYAGVILLRATN